MMSLFSLSKWFQGHDASHSGSDAGPAANETKTSSPRSLKKKEGVVRTGENRGRASTGLDLTTKERDLSKIGIIGQAEIIVIIKTEKVSWRIGEDSGRKSQIDEGRTLEKARRDKEGWVGKVEARKIDRIGKIEAGERTGIIKVPGWAGKKETVRDGGVKEKKIEIDWIIAGKTEKTFDWVVEKAQGRGRKIEKISWIKGKVELEDQAGDWKKNQRRISKDWEIKKTERVIS